jgi:hypothetical protein
MLLSPLFVYQCLEEPAASIFKLYIQALDLLSVSLGLQLSKQQYLKRKKYTNQVHSQHKPSPHTNSGCIQASVSGLASPEQIKNINNILLIASVSQKVSTNQCELKL